MVAVQERVREFSPSTFQQAIFDLMADPKSGDLMVDAVAGSGKTTTIIEGLKRLPAWIAESVLLCAFSKEISLTLARRAPQGTMVKTNHAIGFASLAAFFASKTRGRWEPEVKEWKYRRLIELYWLRNHRDITEPETEAERAMFALVHFARVTLIDTTIEGWAGKVLDMVSEREIEMPEPFQMINALPVILQWGREGTPQRDERGCKYGPEEIIDFDDMIWLPAVLNVPAWKQFKLVLVDECQDLNAAQLAMILKTRAPGGRMVFVGDPRQAIFAFAGADGESFNRIAWKTKAKVLPLSVCYRCPRSVIELARTIVPHIQPADGAPEGTVETIQRRTFDSEVTNHDMVLCRTTAPLIETAFELIRQGKPAKVRGRDIGKQLVKVIDAVEKVEGYSFDEFPSFCESYRFMQFRILTQRKDSEMLVAALHDRVKSVLALHEFAVQEGARTTGDLRAKIDRLFSDEVNGHVMLSTIHRAKGLEAERVFLLHPELLPHPMATSASAREQEENLRYVAVTRALKELFIVETPPKV